MEEINYIEVRERIDMILSKLATELEKSYSEEPFKEYLDEYLKKYECDNVKQLIYLFLCEMKPADLNISLNMRKKIINVSNEINERESDDDFFSSTTRSLINTNNELREEVKSLTELHLAQIKHMEDIKQKYLTLKLQAKPKSDLGR